MVLLISSDPHAAFPAAPYQGVTWNRTAYDGAENAFSAVRQQ